MATINEDYVSFETAKLLKEKGFDEYCPLWYNLDKPIEGPFFYKEIGWYGHNSYDYNGKRIVSAPTLQMAMKWLRVEHDILLFHLPAQENGKLVYLVEVWTWNEEEGIYESTYAPMPRKEPEKAVEAAIKYCLENLI